MRSKKFMQADSTLVERAKTTKKLTNDEINLKLIQQPVPIEPNNITNQTMGTFMNQETVAYASSASWQKHVNDTMSDKTFCFQQEDFSKFMTLDAHRNIVGRVQVKKGIANQNDELKST